MVSSSKTLKRIRFHIFIITYKILSGSKVLLFILSHLIKYFSSYYGLLHICTIAATLDYKFFSLFLAYSMYLIISYG